MNNVTILEVQASVVTATKVLPFVKYNTNSFHICVLFFTIDITGIPLAIQ